jgi:hypothetical protein
MIHATDNVACLPAIPFAGPFYDSRGRRLKNYRHYIILPAAQDNPFLLFIEKWDFFWLSSEDRACADF